MEPSDELRAKLDEQSRVLVDFVHSSIRIRTVQPGLARGGTCTRRRYRMPSTPEGKVKALVKRLLKEMKEEGYPVYYHMPVQNGMGSPTLDFVGCAHGFYFAIETKAPGKELTPRQETTKNEIEKAKGMVFVVRNLDDLRAFAGWVTLLGKT
jgi:hypothetical protein